jgi:tetratricopeptide (TPR) repeat protein
MAIDPWLPVLNSLDLSRFEQEVVSRYEKSPGGRSFLPVSDILRKHNLIDESIELLMQGVARHPDFTVARVVLARELFFKGLIVESWTTLKETKESLTENALAQKLLLKMAVILRLPKEAEKIAEHMTHRMMADEASREIIEKLKLEDFEQFAISYIEQLRTDGLPLADRYDLAANIEAPRPKRKTPVATAPLKVPAEFLPGYERDKMSGFFVAPLTDIFATLQTRENRENRITDELDSTTLAEIYENQGHYRKALDIYRRILKGAPHNEMIAQKVAQLSKSLELEENVITREIDPAILDDMEAMEILDKKIAFYNDLLTRLK